MPRIYHPSPNCPCAGCRATYHDGAPIGCGEAEVQRAAALPEPAISLPPTHQYRRVVVGVDNAPGPDTCRRMMLRPRLAKPNRLVEIHNLLDMPEPDRAVLMEVIRGLPPLAQEKT